jgi:hypothetical protein
MPAPADATHRPQPLERTPISSRWRSRSAGSS